MIRDGYRETQSSIDCNINILHSANFVMGHNEWMKKDLHFFSTSWNEKQNWFYEYYLHTAGNTSVGCSMSCFEIHTEA